MQSCVLFWSTCILGKVDDLVMLVGHLGLVLLVVNPREQFQFLVDIGRLQILVTVALVDGCRPVCVDRSEWIT